MPFSALLTNVSVKGARMDAAEITARLETMPFSAHTGIGQVADKAS